MEPGHSDEVLIRDPCASCSLYMYILIYIYIAFKYIFGGLQGVISCSKPQIGVQCFVYGAL